MFIPWWVIVFVAVAIFQLAYGLGYRNAYSRTLRGANSDSEKEPLWAKIVAWGIVTAMFAAIGIFLYVVSANH